MFVVDAGKFVTCRLSSLIMEIGHEVRSVLCSGQWLYTEAELGHAAGMLL